MRRLFIIAKEDFINLIKNPMWIFYATLFPILLVVIMGFITRKNFGSTVTSYDYYGISLMIYTALSSGMTSANAFMEERIKKPNMRIIYSPGSTANIYLSKIIASFVFSGGFQIIDMLILSLVFHIHLNAIPELIVLLLLTNLFSVVLGVMLCCFFKTEAMTNQILSMIVNSMSVLGGLLFSLDSFGSVIRKISLLSPAKWLMNTSFQMIYDNNLSGFLPTVIILIAGTILMILVCKLTFKKEDCIC